MMSTASGLTLLAAIARRVALGSATLWAKIPQGIRHKIPFQIIRVMSLRPYKLASVSRPGMNTGGLLYEANDFTIQIDNTITRLCSNPKSLFNSLLTVNTSADCVSEVMERAKDKILVIGGTDSTFPAQTDVRFRGFKPMEISRLTKLAHALKHCYVENLTSYAPEFSPIPGGLIPDFWAGSVRLVSSRAQNPDSRNLVFCAHKTRSTSNQWDTRRKVTALARGPWKDFVTVPDGRLTLKQFQQELKCHRFTLCVEGGGIDPSPKAFEALLAGSIPIICESPLADAYRHFPVLIIPAWEEENLSVEILENALQRLSNNFPNWAVVLERLSMNYWLRLIKSGKPTRVFSE